MTDKTESTMSGEERLKARRNKLVSFTAISCAVVLLIGFATGYVGALFTEGAISPAVVVMLWLVGTASFIWLNVAYLRQIDELDKQDNLIGAVAAFAFYLIAYPSWQMFESIGMLPELEWHVFYVATLSVGFLTYLARKLGLR